MERDAEFPVPLTEILSADGLLCPTVLDINRGRLAWWIIILALGAILGYILYSFIGTFLLGLFVYYATRPIYNRLKQRPFPRSIAAIVSLIVVALPALLLLAYTVSIGIRELNAVANAGLGPYEEVIEAYVDTTALVGEVRQLIRTIAEDPRQLTRGNGLQTIQNLLQIAVAYLGVLATGLLHLFIVLALAFYLLRDDYRLSAWVLSELTADETATRRFMRAVDHDLQTVYFGNILTAFAVGIVAALTYNALDLIAPPGLSVPAPTLLGLLTGIASLVPVVGMKLVYVPMTLFLGIVASTMDVSLLWFPLAFFLGALIVADTIPELLLRPYVSGRGLHVGLVMFAYIIGPLLFGWYGIFLAPLLLVLSVHAARIILPVLIHGEQAESRTTPTNPLLSPSNTSEGSVVTQLRDIRSHSASTDPDGARNSPEESDDERKSEARDRRESRERDRRGSEESDRKESEENNR